MTAREPIVQGAAPRDAASAPRTLTPAQDEMTRQHAILAGEATLRMAATIVAMGLSALFLPWQIPLLCGIVNAVAETVVLRLLRDPDLRARRGAYLGCLLTGFVSDLAYVLPAVLILHVADPYAKAFAVGMIMAGLMHLVSTRAVHLPLALVGLSGTTIALFASNAAYWTGRGQPGSFAAATLAIAAVLVYSASTAVHTHRLHRDTARGRAVARAANAAKGRFLAQMSHELRTPLNAVLGLGHAELGRVADPLSRERLSVMIEAAEGLRTMLDDVLDTAMVEAGRLPLRPVAAGPVAEVTATVALFRPLVEAAGVPLRLTVQPGLPCRARFDPQRLRQCLSNLLSNAAKHTKTGCVTVAAGPDPDRPGLLRVAVGDTGPGIARHDRARIFEPFGGDGARGDPTGRGLGLSISRTLARQMGGDLALLPEGAESPFAAGTPATGAVFLLTIALEPAADERPTVPDRAQGSASPARRVLVVDDIATNRLVAVAHLTLLGFEAEEAGSGPEALARVAAGPVPDLVLLDVHMPGMDGAETLARLRALGGAAARVPVVAMTADPSADGAAAAGHRGMDGYLPKPFGPEQMAREIDRLLRPPAAA